MRERASLATSGAAALRPRASSSQMDSPQPPQPEPENGPPEAGDSGKGARAAEANFRAAERAAPIVALIPRANVLPTVAPELKALKDSAPRIPLTAPRATPAARLRTERQPDT